MALLDQNMYKQYYEITNSYLKLFVQFVGINIVRRMNCTKHVKH